MIAQVLVAHLVGDYVLQSHWMATEKTKRWWPAIVHGVTYTLPFLLITRSPAALVVIAVTHVVIDHYRLARHLSWLKNLVSPRPIVAYRYTWPETGAVQIWSADTRRYDGEDVSAGRQVFDGMTVVHPAATKVRGYRPTWEESSATGFPADTPPWLAVWLMIIVDNTVHILINIAAIAYL